MGSGSSGSSGCSTTNQGSTMDDIRQEIKNINGETKQILNRIKFKVGLYPRNAELSGLKEARAAKEAEYTRELNRLKAANDAKEAGYIKEQEGLKKQVDELYGVVEGQVNKLGGLNTNIKSLNTNILSNEHNIESKYKIIDERITNNDIQILESNKARTDINRAGFSIAYFEYLLLSSYNLIYRAIHYENNSIDSGKDHRESSNANKLSNDVYQNDRVDFYKNVNTFLFYFYYLMIIALVIVVLKFNNTSLLIKLTFFRVFAIFLILYPIFIIRFQDFVYWFVKLMISKI
jgi:hypothetical protein